MTPEADAMIGTKDALEARAERLMDTPFNGLGLWTEDEQCDAAEVIRDLLAEVRTLRSKIAGAREAKTDGIANKSGV